MGLTNVCSYAASHRAVREMKVEGLLPEDTTVRSSKYLNNLIEQDHRHIKSRTNVMLGLKRFGSAATTISGIESTYRIRKKRVSSISRSLASKILLLPPYRILSVQIDKVSFIHETSQPDYLFAPERCMIT